MKPLYFFLPALVALVACSSVSDRYLVTPPQATQNQRIAFRAVEIRDISLPAYAADDEIVLRAGDGRLESDGTQLWGDTPARAIALELSRHLAQISGARVASNPWPFEALPDARLDLRFENLIAGTDGIYRATGQFFVAVAENGRERSGLFDLSVAFDPETGPSAIATARGQLILDLAEEIARRALR
ncbi:MAG: membrane integrity-associated transporter subunit PqiC [Roseobacter sp.]